MENEPFEDVFPIENGDFPLLCLITGVYMNWMVSCLIDNYPQEAGVNL